jgi:hypothetical protein
MMLEYALRRYDIDIEVSPVKTLLVEQVVHSFRIEEEEWIKRYDNHKDTPWDKLEGMSQREALIWMSEEVFKPKFGKDFYGKMYTRMWENEILAPELLLIPDAGFIEEDKTIIEYFGKDNCVMINTYREGTTFENDSRYLITGDDLGIKGYDVRNNGTIDDLKAKVPTFTDIVLEYLELI